MSLPEAKFLAGGLFALFLLVLGIFIGVSTFRCRDKISDEAGFALCLATAATFIGGCVIMGLVVFGPWEG